LNTKQEKLTISNERFKSFRGLIRLSQEEYAIFLNCSPSSIRLYESGSQPIPSKVLNRLADCGANLEWFLCIPGVDLKDSGSPEKYRKGIMEYIKIINDRNNRVS